MENLNVGNGAVYIKLNIKNLKSKVNMINPAVTCTRLVDMPTLTDYISGNYLNF